MKNRGTESYNEIKYVSERERRENAKITLTITTRNCTKETKCFPVSPIM